MCVLNHAHRHAHPHARARARARALFIIGLQVSDCNHFNWQR